jgi:glycine C-acetyltransferase/8-amino-7-oxononanoate synthase
VVAGNMTLHRRLEERLADFMGAQSAVLLGSGYLAAVGVIPALARPGELVFADAANPPALADGCRLCGADVVTYRHADADHLRWALRNADGRAALIVTSTVFPVDGDVAPLVDIVALARRHDARVLADEAHGLGVLGPGGRGAVAAAGLESEVDVVCGTFGTALGGYGGFASCDVVMARHLVSAAAPLAASTGLPPAAAAAALAALEVLEQQPRRVERLAENAETLRSELAREGLGVSAADTYIVAVPVGEARRAVRIAEAALEQGVFVQAVCPPAVPEGEAAIRLTVMATHTRAELREAALVLGRAARAAGLATPAPAPVAPAGRPALFDVDAEELARAA